MKLVVFSDVHFAGPEEQLRRGHESRAISNPLLRWGTTLWRQWVWLRDPYAHNHRLDQLLDRNPSPDVVVANGDYTLDTAFVGVSDAAACASASTVLERLRSAYGDRVWAILGDHELGKKSLFGGHGGMRWASWEACRSRLRVPGVWRHDFGRWTAMGLTSSLLALPVFEDDVLPEERNDWNAEREVLLAWVRDCFAGLPLDRRVLLFVHDPSALPFLAKVPEVRARLGQVERTVVGHLHSPAIFGLAQTLAGAPQITGLGHSIRRYSGGLRSARCWRDFRTVLCPSPAGSELFHDGGWLEFDLDVEHGTVRQFRRHRLPW